MRTNRIQLIALFAAGLMASGCDTADDEAGAAEAHADSGAGGGGGGGQAREPGGEGAGYDEYDEGGAAGGGGGGATDGAGAPPPAGDMDGAEPPPVEPPDENTEQYDDVGTNPFVDTAEDNLSTFSVDVDTASYTIMRRDVNNGRLPDPDSVRIEEYVNFFDYDYPQPDADDETPFAVDMEVAPSRFGDGLHLLRIGVQGRDVPPDERKPANLVFLIDVSGSMNTPDKLGLVKFSLDELTSALQPDDTVALVTYAGADTIALPPTPVENRALILEAIEGLAAGGGTNGAAGITTAYDLAEDAFREGGINRVVLCTDGDFNVGLTGEALVERVVSWRDRGIFLSVLGYGHGNLNDAFLERLTNEAEGTYSFVDSRNEALRVLGTDLVGTLQVIAKDVKMQVEFDVDTVSRFRLIGYENRVLAHEDFDNDAVDAAELGSGHSVTALYEVEIREGVEPADELVKLRMRYKQPIGGDSREVTWATGMDATQPSFEEASADFRFAAAVAEYAEVLRGSRHAEEADLDAVGDVAEAALRAEEDPDRVELVELVRAAAAMIVP